MERRASHLVVLAAAAAAALGALVGCGGGGASSSSVHAAGRGSADETSAAAHRRQWRDEVARRRQVREAEMVRGDEGWARTGEGVFWTADSGHTWHQITPPVDPEKLQGVQFADSRHGWALAELGEEVATRPILFTTADGGHSWRRVEVPIEGLLLPAAGVSFSAVGDEVFALIRESGDTASNVGFLIATRDSGRSWSLLPQPPQAGSIDFESARDGWLASGYPDPHLWRTHDGGRSWVEADPPGRSRFGSFGISYLPPRIRRNGHGIVAAVRVVGLRGSLGPTHASAAVYVTGDSGRHWRLASTIRLSRIGGTLEASGILSYRGRGLSLLVHNPYTFTTTPVDADGEPGRSFTPRWLPHWASVSLSGRRYGFALSVLGRHRGFASSADGGRTWRRATRPGRWHS